MADFQRDYDLVHNWGLRCFEVQRKDTGLMLKCSKSGAKKKDRNGNAVVDENGKQVYAKGLSISVWCGYNTCQITPGDYEKQFINVDGQFVIDDWVNEQGETKQKFTIFATKVTLREFN